MLDAILDNGHVVPGGDGAAAGAVLESALGPTAARERYDLSLEDCHALLAEVGWGVLSTVEPVEQNGTAVRPYAVPIAYAFDGVAVYIATGPGRKLRALERNPRIALTVSDVTGLSRWRSVVVTGTAVPLTQAASRAAAVCSFVAQRRSDGHRLTPRDVRRLVAARVFRVQFTEVSGCACAPDGEQRSAAAAHGGTEAPLPAAATGSNGGDPAATRTLDGVRRIVRALRTTGAAADRAGGISPAQLFTLREIAAHPGQSLHDLAARTLTTQGAVSEVVARLVERGLVVRREAPEDRRRAELTVSPAGYEILGRAVETTQERLIAGLRRLPDGQRRTLADGLQAWLSAAGLDSDVPSTMFFEQDGPTPDGAARVSLPKPHQSRTSSARRSRPSGAR